MEKIKAISQVKKNNKNNTYIKKEKIYISDTKLINEWDYEKNNKLGIYPNELTLGSGKKVYWQHKIEKENIEYMHEWQDSVSHRSYGRNCPICSNYKILKGYNDLETTNPKLAKEWNYNKNILKPDEITEGSNKEVWWQCYKGHEWKMKISERKKGNNCPICSNHKILKGFNDLQTLNSKLAKEWNYDKNTLKPDEIGIGSCKKVWWICSKGHEWQATVVHRNKGTDCPYCKGKKAIKGYNDLKTTNPELAEEWNYSKNTLKPNEVKVQSNIKVWWIDKFNHEWECSIADRINGNGCPFCSGHRVLKGFNDLETLNPELAKEWNYSKNILKPDEVSLGSNKKIWWICPKGHEWNSVIANRSKGAGCPYCQNQKILKGYNYLEFLNPKLAKEWNYDKNILKPDEIGIGSCKKVWWICSKGHEWQATVVHRNKGTDCPYCKGKKAIKGYNDLKTTNPELAKEWNYKKNKLKPDEVFQGSGKKIWWICSKGHEWNSVIANRSKGTGCPYCKESHGEKQIANLLKIYNINYKREYQFKDCKNINSLPFDFCIFDKSNKIQLMIEYDGIQHFKAIDFFGGKENLKKRQKNDKIKTDYCKKNKIPLLRITYKEFDKIEEILKDNLSL